ncbi:hypothetical protein K439DRAFT_766895 [Ramaria rubella]|nr:hypothetical protein K439DRAFT_766895 [Ramaria rubella]
MSLLIRVRRLLLTCLYLPLGLVGKEESTSPYGGKKYCPLSGPREKNSICRRVLSLLAAAQWEWVINWQENHNRTRTTASPLRRCSVYPESFRTAMEQRLKDRQISLILDDRISIIPSESNSTVVTEKGGSMLIL